MVSFGNHNFFIVADQFIFASSDVLSDRNEFPYNKTVYGGYRLQPRLNISHDKYICYIWTMEVENNKAVKRTGGKIPIYVELVGQ